jgi:hypothetical protein
MRLPVNVAINQASIPVPTRVIAPAVSAAPMMRSGVQPSIDIGCVLSTAAGCFFKCGLDVPCLLACAPGLAKCL